MIQPELGRFPKFALLLGVKLLHGGSVYTDNMTAMNGDTVTPKMTET